MSEPVDENSRSRKVPPLRISLPRTASEDNTAVVNAEESGSVAAGTRNGKRNRFAKAQIKKEVTPDTEPTPPPDGVHRMTRSRLKKAGGAIKDEPASGTYLDGTTKRKCLGIRQRSAVPSVSNVSSPMLPLSNIEKEESETNGESTIYERREPKSEEASCPVADGTSALVMSLMKKNTYEGFRGLRAKIEESWMNSVNQAAPKNPELPPNYENYMIVKKSYTLREDASQELLARDFQSKANLTPELQEIYRTQEQRRVKMEMKHRIERERLQMQAEREVMRLQSRKANLGRDSMSAVRLLQETEIYNTQYLNEKRKQREVVEIEVVKERFDGQIVLMENRQKMESDALYAEQVYSWNRAVKNAGHSLTSWNPVLQNAVEALKDTVPRVPITHLELNL